MGNGGWACQRVFYCVFLGLWNAIKTSYNLDKAMAKRKPASIFNKSTITKFIFSVDILPRSPWNNALIKSMLIILRLTLSLHSMTDQFLKRRHLSLTRDKKMVCLEPIFYILYLYINTFIQVVWKVNWTV